MKGANNDVVDEMGEPGETAGKFLRGSNIHWPLREKGAQQRSGAFQLITGSRHELAARLKGGEMEGFALFAVSNQRNSR